MHAQHVVLLPLLLAAILLTSCSGQLSNPPKTEKRAPMEISTPAMLPPTVERENIGEVLELNTTPRGGDEYWPPTARMTRL